ncbi:MAG: DsrE/DsrF/DrsH-like family protein [Prevotellaceae bacterium]|jgi:peroxiredoxin family protein/rhodanese-related sulfurtransferase/TusA-related sulfurtransferase|nr:DsrE/DsrF/DrsH-like family protein [Prevotellaceae bacterium]
MKKLKNELSLQEMHDADRKAVAIIDVRTPEEFKMGAIKGAKNIPLEEIPSRMKEIPKDKPVYLYCASGHRAAEALEMLTKKGYKNAKNLTGGYSAYSLAYEHKTQPARRSRLKNATMIKIDASGLECPEPVMKLKHAIDKMKTGEQVEVTATDAAFIIDSKAWSHSTGNIIVSSKANKGKYIVVVEKGKAETKHTKISGEDNSKTFILFSDDLDRALATFVLANAAAATGKRVTIFFTFWGLNVIKKVKKPRVKKDIFGKMFSIMLVSNSLKLKLSKLNMLGIGSKMMRYIMKRKGIESLETLRAQAIEQGVEFISCQMSMDVMGIQKEELLDNVIAGGAASYMERAEKASVNLFI